MFGARREPRHGSDTTGIQHLEVVTAAEPREDQARFELCEPRTDADPRAETEGQIRPRHQFVLAVLL